MFGLGDKVLLYEFRPTNAADAHFFATDHHEKMYAVWNTDQRALIFRGLSDCATNTERKISLTHEVHTYWSWHYISWHKCLNAALPHGFKQGFKQGNKHADTGAKYPNWVKSPFFLLR